jgi:hypothetical protein
MKIIYLLSHLSPKKLKLFALKKIPIYLLIVLIFIMYGVKGLMTTFFLALFFFLGWTFKSVYQAFHDWRLTQRLNRVYFSAADYDSMERENKLLHDALNAFKENAKRSGGAGVRNDAPIPHSVKPRIDHQAIQEMLLQMGDDAK